MAPLDGMWRGEIDDSLLPAKRNSSRSITQKSNSSYFESCRGQFEKYLQYLCSNPLLKGSALLFNFFSPDKEFSQMFGPEKKGQNIDLFLQAFLSSTVEPTKRKPLPKGLLEQSQRIEEGIYPLRIKNSLLVCGKVAFQQTLDTYADRYLAHKVDLLTNEHRVAMIIHLLREKLERREKTLREMLAFLPEKRDLFPADDLSSHS
ncbi:Sorting nexin-14 [Acropora cervicornis]|uniref:Sorting nexin-14 n=1 Tax=Acropora cervicornis TaxID=6130 RepID=A0AAD9VF09_ACRCE|nr:Sorting nexin-14 [Acropora cervicornis]